MNGEFEHGCSHQRLIRVISSDSTLRNAYRCEECQVPLFVGFIDTPASSVRTVTMNTLSSSGYHMEVDVSSQMNHQVQSVTMESIISSASSHTMEVDERSSTAIKTSPTPRLASEFECLEKLGQGGFGLVRKYKNKTDGKFYAIKKIEATKNGGGKMKKEVELLSELERRNIVRYYNCWIESTIANGDVLYIQMEFCENRTLREAIESRELALNRFRVWKLFRQIVEGINHFHSKRVIHRDLKVLISSILISLLTYIIYI